MKFSKKQGLAIAGVVVLGCSGAAISALAADNDAPLGSPADSGSNALEEITVTATRRAESANKVPISISVLSGDELKANGITNTSDLAKVVPGFTFTQSQYGPPVYTLRGIGFYDTSIGAKPSVSVYSDETPIPFSIETKGASMDLERVEVLKGPQGTLYGQNATGGAVNYIAAKPTKEFDAGADVGFGSYGAADVDGFVSGPLSDTLSARFAFETQQGGGYQYSVTRPGDTLGDRNFSAARLLFAYTPSDSVRMSFGVNGFLDHDTPLAGQAIAVTPLGTVPANNPIYFTTLGASNDRQADWTASERPQAANRFVQVYGRGDFDLSDKIVLTSISAYSHFAPNYHDDPDGSTLDIVSYHTTGSITSYSQELRLAGEATPSLRYIVGGNFSVDKTHEFDLGSIPDSSSAPAFNAFGLGNLELAPLLETPG